jgi:hypothetical protein
MPHRLCVCGVVKRLSSGTRSDDSLLTIRLLRRSTMTGAVHLPLYPGWQRSYTSLTK